MCSSSGGRPPLQLALCADHNAPGPIGSQYYQQTPLLAHTHRGISLRDQLTDFSNSALAFDLFKHATLKLFLLFFVFELPPGIKFVYGPSAAIFIEAWVEHLISCDPYFPNPMMLAVD